MRIAIGLGASMGDRRRTLERTVQRLDAWAPLRLRAVSAWVASPPMAGGTASGWFLNGVALFDADVAPPDVLAHCVELEQQAGRRRARYWGDRPLDLDVLVAEGWQSDAPELVVPHPGILARAFVWWPLRQVWPDALPGLATLPPHPPGIVPVGVLAHTRPLAYDRRPVPEALP